MPEAGIREAEIAFARTNSLSTRRPSATSAGRRPGARWACLKMGVRLTGVSVRPIQSSWSSE